MSSSGYVPWDGVLDHHRRIMKSNRGRDTAPELRVRSALHRLGLRFRVSPMLRVGGRRMRPDVVFTRWRVAVFVDGCFWHGCPEHGTVPTRNRQYWKPKISDNQLRDRLNSEVLAAHGWTVIRAWEHDDPEAVARRVQAALAHVRATSA